MRLPYGAYLVACCRHCCFFSSRRRHTRLQGDWSSDVCSSDLQRGDGNDALMGGAGADTIFGDAGDDLLSGGLGEIGSEVGRGREWIPGGVGYFKKNTDQIGRLITISTT